MVRIEDGVDLAEFDFVVPAAGDRRILDVLPGLDRLAVLR